MALQALTIDISARAANLEAGLKRAEGQLASFASRAESAVAGVGVAFGALAGAAALGGFVEKLHSAIESMDALNDASDATGSSVEELSALMNTLAPYGTTLDTITDATGKLARAMAGADDDTKGAGEAFAKLGVETRDAAGNLRPTVEVLYDIAKALAQYDDGTNKTVIAQALFGKTGAALLPMLKDLAGAQREAATVTTEQAAEAERLNKAINALRNDSENFAKAIASAVIPTLADLIEQFRAVGREGGTFWDQIRGVLGAEKGLRDRRADLEGLLAQRADAARMGFSEASLRDYDARIEQARRSIAGLERATRIERGPNAVQDQYDGVTPSGPAPTKGAAPALRGVDKAAQDAADSYRELDRLIAQSLINDQLAEDANAAKLLADGLKMAVTELERLEGLTSASLEAALKPDNAGWQKVADTLREIRGIDPAAKLRDSALEVANTLLEAGTITFDEYEKLGSKILELKDPIAEVADSAASMFAPINSALEDAIINMRSLGDVTKSLLTDIARVMLRTQVTGPLEKFLTASSGGKSTAGIGDGTIFGAIRDWFTGSSGPELLNGFAGGGDPPVGVPSLVGEQGPELFVPKVAGTIVPNGKFGGGVTVVNNISVSGSASRADVYNAVALAEQRTKASILGSMQRNGSFAR